MFYSMEDETSAENGRDSRQSTGKRLKAETRCLPPFSAVFVAVRRSPFSVIFIFFFVVWFLSTKEVQEQMKRRILVNTYGSTFPLKMDRDRQMLSRMMSDYVVEPINDGISEFNVEFHGPKETASKGNSQH